MKICGIGDLHLDGRLKKYIPNFNQFVISEVRSVVEKAISKGCSRVIFYGDIGDKPKLSYEAHELLLSLFVDYKSIKFYLLKGNHDHHDDHHTGLDLLKAMCDLKLLTNVKVITEPLTLAKGTSTSIRFLPWPHTSVCTDSLNVLHIETQGSTMDSGRKIPEGHGAKIPEDAVCVSGHLHTAHRVKNFHYSGTLYQTGFGESEKKYWHLINIDEDTGERVIKNIPHSPKYVLKNIIVKSLDDVKTLPKDEFTLCKVFVNSSVTLPANAFDNYPNVVKTNTFKSKEELEALILEDFVLDDYSTAANFELNTALEDWLDVKKIDKELRQKVLKLNSKFLNKG